MYDIARRFALISSVVLWAAPVHAQTGLLIVGHSRDRMFDERLQEAAALLAWPYGPVNAFVIHDRPSLPDRWADALTALSENTLDAVVAVPVGFTPTPAEFEAMRQSTDAAVTVAETVGDAIPAQAARGIRLVKRIERSAARATERLQREGRLHPYQLATITVTATGEDRWAFGTPRSITALTEDVLRERAPNNAADVFRDVPGLDVDGVGPNQHRPIIRGLGGQRVLLLEDGLRLANTRRDQDIIEPPAIVDVTEIERVEIVRGASSVLYGSDAIGGVVNLITKSPGQSTGSDVRGNLSYRYSTVGRQSHPAASLSGRTGRFAFRVSGAYRNADSYQAPAGSFGDLTLAGDTPVNDTGIEDHHVTAYVGYRAPRHHGVFFKFARYRANDAGFGFVDPSDLGEEGATLQLLFPNRRFERYTAGYDASDLSAPIADVVRVVAYLQNNERQFNTNVTGPLGPPGAQLEVRSENFTDLETYGFRVEAQKTVSGLHRITYGVDLFRDRSTNTDTSTTTITGFGPPSISGRGTPRVPNATFRSLGSFVQAELTVTDRATVTIGGRYQDVRAATRETPGIDDPFFEAIDRTVVATGNVAYRVTDHLNALASIGRAFRSPNLVERFFTGPSPEGRAVWVRNPDLQAETSLNLEIGAKYLAANVRIEGYIFRNTIYDGIRREPTGNTVNNRPELRNVNVEKLRYTGIELSGEVDLIRSVTVGAHLTQVDATNALEPDMPLGDSYSSKLGAHLRYRDPNGRFWVQYGVRRNGEREDVVLDSPVGTVFPAFTVHELRAGAALSRRQRLDVAILNLGNALYAEAPNIGFFRPEPKRNLLVSLTVGF